MSTDRIDPYQVFRPRAARWVATAAAAGFVAGLLFLGWVIPPRLAVTDPWSDRIGYVLLAALGATVLLRHAGVRAVPDAEGLTVRNLVYTRRVTWTQIVSVRFGPDRPWVQLDLTDGGTLAVMGVQRADGALADREARRLATLAARHSEPPSAAPTS